MLRNVGVIQWGNSASVKKKTWYVSLLKPEQPFLRNHLNIELFWTHMTIKMSKMKGIEIKTHEIKKENREASPPAKFHSRPLPKTKCNLAKKTPEKNL